MVEPYETRNNNGEAYQMVGYHHGYNRISSSSTTLLSSPLLDLRVFYVRISNFKVDDSTPEIVTITHIPLDPDSLLKINGVRMSIHSQGLSSQPRRDSVDKKSESATFISTYNIRLSGSVKFKVYDKDELVLSETLDMSGSNGFTGESTKHSVKRWSMNCEAEITAGSDFLKEKHVGCFELSSSFKKKN